MRLCKNLNFDVKSVQPNIGLEQEFFFVPRDAYYRRPDLQLTGRSVMGKEAPRGQEMSDHYMSPPNQLAMDCMREIQHECFLMGIPLRTRHREVGAFVLGESVMPSFQCPLNTHIMRHFSSPSHLPLSPLSLSFFTLSSPLPVFSNFYSMSLGYSTQVAPNQYEFAPMFGLATTQIDQNLMVMQIAEEVSARHGLACLMQEKPFKGVNGSGE